MSGLQSVAKSNRKAALSLLEPLADAMQMRLILRDQLGKFSIYGSGDFELPLDGPDVMRLKCDVQASTVSLGQEAWVIIKVGQNLSVFLLYSVTGGVLSFAIIDVNEELTKKIAELKGHRSEMVVAVCAKNIKATFQRDRFKAEWRELNVIADSVDAGQDTVPEAGHSISS
jgi:hypothetical protein